MNEPVKYIPPTFLPHIFEAIESYLQGENDPVPHYSSDKLGCEKVVAVLKMMRTQYYPDFYSKAAYLLMSVDKGHFFSNGNKRLAATLLKIFYTLNGYKVKPRPLPAINLSSSFSELVLGNNYIDKDFFEGDEQLSFLYMIAHAVVDEKFKDIKFDDWKILLQNMLRESLTKER